MTQIKKQDKQMSEAFITTVFLTLSGGFQDAYTYVCRDQVFANAQTGNIVLMAADLCSGSWRGALQYFFPLLAFAVGVYVSEYIRHHYHHQPRFHWRQVVVTIEILILIAVGFMPVKWNLVANVMVSFVCALQVQTFRKVEGNAYASTMCIGNLRSGVNHFYAWMHNKNPKSKEQAMAYFSVIGLFALGAAAGSMLSLWVGTQAIWCSCALLGISLLLMMKTEKR